ncbi:MAG TPA: monovalent cation/H(+) antiporter subunit G [Acidimicrobiia bacterium]|nr:monovalent cation/H(+) antiporter subunit G [Acidimicrobiia bacterium]
MEPVASILIVAGAVLALLAAFGLQRFDDVFARMHSATKPATLGLILILSGAAFMLPVPGAVAKLLLVVMLQFTTAPIAAHLVGRAAFRTGQELSRDTMVVEEAEYISTHPKLIEE